MKGTAYCVGVGPGDPELMTLKAIRLIRENGVIAVPGSDARASAAFKIAKASFPEIENKELVPVYMPMVNDRKIMAEEHEKGAKLIESYLDKGESVVYLTLGDPAVYCTFSYLQHILEKDGYKVKLVSGVPSFCAAAAALNISLAEWDEALHIIPALHKIKDELKYDGNCVLMKSGLHMKEVKELLKSKKMRAQAVENCGMENEKIYKSLDEIPDDAGYFSLIVAKKG